MSSNNVASHMHAIEVVDSGDGSRPQLKWTITDTPTPGEGEVLVKVAAAGVNRADLAQVAGSYPPPPGASEVLGLEVAGTIVDCGAVDDCEFSEGEQVCALLAGGGYAEYVAVPHRQLFPIPRGWTAVQAASIVEVASTVWSNLVLTGHISAGDMLLVHGGAGGIGSCAIQVAKALGCTVAATAGTPEKVDMVRRLGADIAINYREENFAEVLRNKCDIILDVVGGRYLGDNVSALARDGRLLIIGLIGGTRGELNVGQLLAKRASIAATTIRSLSPDAKAAIVRATRDRVWPMLAAGSVTPQVGRVLPVAEAGEAHRLMAKGEVSGKIVLEMPAP